MVYTVFFCVTSCVLLIISMFRVASVKHWMKTQVKVLEDKKKELDELIYSASDMVNELNHVSDYVVTVVEQKNLEFNENIKTIDDKVNEIKELFNQGNNGKVINFPHISEIVGHSKKSEIEELYNDGYSVSDIAKELGVGKGEIELMLGITERYMEVAN